MPSFRASIVEYCAEHDGYRCGYCKSADGNYSRGIWAHCLDPRDYQNLIDRGWRRSGKYCYKPTMRVTCCPLYTIRCEAPGFKLSKSQKKVLKKVNNFLISGKKPVANPNDNETFVSENNDICDMPSEVFQKYSSKEEPQLDLSSEAGDGSSKVISNCDQEPSSSCCTDSSNDLNHEMDTSGPTSSGSDKSSTPKKGLGADPTRPPCRKAKEIRLENKRQKLMKKAIQGELSSEQLDQLLVHKKKCPNESKSVEEFLKEAEVENAAHRLRIRQIRPGSAENKKSVNTEFSVYQSYQMSIHKEKPNDCDINAFQNFLVSSPLMESQPGGPACGYGIFHQQYWLDDTLIAVGVIDILPNCVSSVYLFYDPAYSFLSLGVYSAIREIAFTRELHLQSSSLQYYYMGFYIHSCPKMRYKAQFNPSYLLCPETYSWVPYSKCLPKLEASKYSRLDDDPSKVDEDGVVDLSRVWILHNQKPKRYPAYVKASSNEDQEEVNMYAALVGKKCYSKMLLFRN